MPRARSRRVSYPAIREKVSGRRPRVFRSRPQGTATQGGVESSASRRELHPLKNLYSGAEA